MFQVVFTLLRRGQNVCLLAAGGEMIFSWEGGKCVREGKRLTCRGVCVLAEARFVNFGHHFREGCVIFLGLRSSMLTCEDARRN